MRGPTSRSIVAPMTKVEVERLATEAREAFAAGLWQPALAASLRLERAEPGEPEWPRQTARVLEAMGRSLDRIDALERAAERHARRGELLPAAVVCKQILTLDPAHAATRARLAGLRAAHVKTKPTLPTVPRVSSSVWNRPEGSGLRAVPLRKVVPGARADSSKGRTGVHAIPLSSPAQLPLHLAASEEPTTGTLELPALGSAEDRAVEAVEQELQAAVRTERTLSKSPLFDELPQGALHDLIDRARMVRFSKDASIFRQGDSGDTLFVVVDGEVGVIDEGPPRRAVSKILPGDFFGEMALVGGAPRSATCAALTDVELIALDHEVMAGVLREHPGVLTVLLRYFRDRSIERVLSTSPLFSCLSPRDRAAIRPHFRFLEVEPGASIIREGTVPEGVVVVLGGRAEAVRAEPEGERRLGWLGPGELAGEMSLLRGSPALATVRAVDKLLAVEFPARAFRKILEARPQVRAIVERTARSRGVSVSSGRGLPGAKP